MQGLNFKSLLGGVTSGISEFQKAQKQKEQQELEAQAAKQNAQIRQAQIDKLTAQQRFEQEAKLVIASEKIDSWDKRKQLIGLAAANGLTEESIRLSRELLQDQVSIGRQVLDRYTEKAKALLPGSNTELQRLTEEANSNEYIKVAFPGGVDFTATKKGYDVDTKRLEMSMSNYINDFAGFMADRSGKPQVGRGLNGEQVLIQPSGTRLTISDMLKFEEAGITPEEYKELVAKAAKWNIFPTEGEVPISEKPTIKTLTQKALTDAGGDISEAKSVIKKTVGNIEIRNQMIQELDKQKKQPKEDKEEQYSASINMLVQELAKKGISDPRFELWYEVEILENISKKEKEEIYDRVSYLIKRKR